MKLSITCVALFLPVLALAQDYPGMSEADMQKMMQQMQEAQACMQGIDQSRMQEFEQRGRQMEAEIKALCAGGKRDAAEEKALAFAMEMNKDPDLRKMRECGEKMRGAMPVMPYMNQPAAPDESGGHICDP